MLDAQHDIARAILDNVPAAERQNFIHGLANKLSDASDDVDVSIVAAFLDHQPDSDATDVLLSRLRKRIDLGSSDSVARLCLKSTALSSQLFTTLSLSVCGFVNGLTSDSTGLIVFSNDKDHVQNVKESAGADNETSLQLSHHTVQYVKLLQRLGIKAAPITALSSLFDACLILLGATERSLSQAARDMLAAIMSDHALTPEQSASLWYRLTELLNTNEPSAHTIACSVWLRWLGTMQEGLLQLVAQSQYWRLIIDGLRNGDAERRKNFLQILRGSVDVAVHDDACISMIVSKAHFSFDPDAIRVQFVRFCTIFETIVLGRYLNQVQECEADLDFLCSPHSIIAPVWLYTLLAASLDNKMQESNRKFISNWVFRSTLPIEDIDDFARLFGESFLPWMLQGYHFTSSLIKNGAGLRSLHGDSLAEFVARTLSGDLNVTSKILGCITANILGRQGNNFAYAMVYLMEGIGRAVENATHSIIGQTQILHLEAMAGWIGLPEVARDHVLARFWKICYIEHKRQNVTDENVLLTKGAELWLKLVNHATTLGEYPSSDVDGTIASLRFESSRREINEGLTKQKCNDLLRDLGPSENVSINKSELEERIEDIWTDLEYLEFPKGILVTVSKTLLHPRMIAALNRHSKEGHSVVDLSALLHKLRETSTTRSYLLPHLAEDIRRLALQEGLDCAILKLEEFIVGIAQQPPSATVDAQLEDATAALIPGISPELKKYDYEYYFGRRESFGFAAVLDMVARLGAHNPTAIHSIVKTLLSRWTNQKVPPPAVSPWKKNIQLQIMLLCLEQYMPTLPHDEAEKLLTDLQYLLAIEPLPRYRYLFEWMIVRVYMCHPQLRYVILKELDTKDHHSNPKFLAALMRIGLILAKLDSSDEAFALKLATTFVPLSASSKVIIRHEAQWQVPFLLDHARQKGWISITSNPLSQSLDEYIRSLERFSDPPPDRQIDTFDPTTDNTLTHLLEGPWYRLDRIEQKYSGRADLELLYKTDQVIGATISASCLPLGKPIDHSRLESGASIAENKAFREHIVHKKDDIALTAPMNNLAPAALQTKGTAYLEISRTRFTDLLVIASLVDNPYNLGGLSRVSEIFGAGAMYLERLQVVSNKDFTGVSVSSHMHLDIRALLAANVAGFLAEKKKTEGYTVVGIEQTDRSLIVGDPRCVLPDKCILVLGSEAKGIPALLLSECDLLVEIPQVGITRSLNVQTAAAIVLCEYAKQRKAAVH